MRLKFGHHRPVTSPSDLALPVTFKTMNDLRSLVPPSSPSSERSPLKIGDNAPLLKGLSSDKPAIVAFLRHIGCPFAEKTFLNLRAFADQHDESYQYIAITHGSQTDTNDWVKEIGGAGRITVVSDPDREIYGQWVCVSKDLGNSRAWGDRDGYIGLDGVV